MTKKEISFKNPIRVLEKTLKVIIISITTIELTTAIKKKKY